MTQTEKTKESRKKLFEIYEQFNRDPYFSYPSVMKDDSVYFEEIVILGYPTKMDNALLIIDFINSHGMTINCILDVEEKIKNSFKWSGIKMSTYEDFINQNKNKNNFLFVDFISSWVPYNKIVRQLKKSYTVVKHEHFINAPRYLNTEQHDLILSKSLLPVVPVTSPLFPFYYAQNFEKILVAEKLFCDEKSLLVFYTTLMGFISTNYTHFAHYCDDYNNNRYIANDVDFVFTENEIFADCGAYDGADSILFSNLMNKKFDYIHAFEADFRNFFNAQKNIEKYKKVIGLDNINVYPLAVWNNNTVLPATGNEVITSLTMNPDKTSSTNLHCVMLDGFLDNLTYLKLEVEGAEVQALEGATGLIKKHKPKLAVSTYHLSDDFITIPQTILNFDKNYKFYLRRHSLDFGALCFYCH